MQTKKLNLGSGNNFMAGYENVDRHIDPASVQKAKHVDGIARREDVYPLQDGDRSCDEVRASHILEHFSHRQTLDVVKEWARVLKPGGILKIAVPNFDKIVQMYSDGSDLNVESYLMGSHTDGDDHHGAIFNEQKLRGLMKLAGLVNIRPWTSEIDDCAKLPVSLNLMGNKLTVQATFLEGVHAVLSMPRLCFTDQSVCMLETSAKLKIPTRIRQGVFWGQTLTQAIEQSLEDGAKFILAVDYDTIFAPDDVMELYRLMEATPRAGAIFATQIGRDRNSPLLTIRKSSDENAAQITRAEADAELLKASTGHFGLTLIRREVFDLIGKPWFHHTPDPELRWGDGRTDEDIHFWRICEKAGVVVHQANHVRVGHLQLVVTWPNQNLEPIHQYVGDFRRDGRPTEVSV